METTPLDLSNYRLNNWKWYNLYREQLGAEEFDAYYKRVWKLLDSFKENQYYKITNVTLENRDLFIKICCQYILTHREYELSNDYTQIKRRECKEGHTLGRKSRNNS